MKNWKLMLTALSLGGAVMLSGCVVQPGEGGYYGGDYGYYGASGTDYCGGYGCPVGDYDLFYGGAYYGGGWYDNPLYYRDFGGGRQFWINGGWHRDEWRGPHPEDHRGHDAAWWRERGLAQGGNNNRNTGRAGVNRNDDRGFTARDNGGRSGDRSNQSQSQSQAAQPAQAQDRGSRGDGGGRSFSRGDGSGGRASVGNGDNGGRSFSRGDGGGRPSGGGDNGSRASGNGGGGGGNGGGGGSRSSGGGGGSSSGSSSSGSSGGGGGGNGGGGDRGRRN